MKLLSPATDLVPRLMLLLYGMKRRIFIASNSTKVLVLLTALQNIVILSIIVTVSADIESTNRLFRAQRFHLNLLPVLGFLYQSTDLDELYKPVTSVILISEH